MRGFPSLLAFLAASVAAGCAQPGPADPAPTTVVVPAAPSAAASSAPSAPEPARILAMARACAERPPLAGRGVGGTPLRWEGGSVARAPAAGESSTWIVHFPEQQVRSLPTGLDIVVNTTTGACGMAPMD